MKHLQIYTMEQSEQWDRIVRSFKEYDVYYLSGYVKAFQIHGDGEPLLFYYENDSLRGINVVMKRDISKDEHFTGILEENLWYDFATPYGYGGWLIEGEGNSDELFNCYEGWCINNNIVSEFVRYHPVLENQNYSNSFYNTIALGNTIAIDTHCEETIWNNLTSKNRNMIRKAQKSGMAVYNGRYPESYETFREIYNGTMDKDCADKYYYFEPEFYKSILQDIPWEAQVFFAVLDDRVIAASIVLGANSRLNYHLSGSLDEYRSLAPTNLLLYNTALWGSNNGYQTLHLGGGLGSQKDGLYRFKESFNRKESCDFYIGKRIYCHDKYLELNIMRDIYKVESDGFFPKYREKNIKR